jgi:hypothetical protein
MDASKRAPLPPAAYVNFLRVAQQRSEFFLAFGQVTQEQVGGAHLVASLVTSPAHAKSMLRALEEAVRRYEERFGEIPVPVAAAAGPIRPLEAPPRRDTAGARSREPRSGAA